ncbi:hypothetical protein, partial [Alteromonas sp. CNT1-28]|uniref:hypothetical protein n=1 Tax=Alteromonas sp. CNT1-28 TaxID=2917730 RepID=UPI001EF35017
AIDLITKRHECSYLFYLIDIAILFVGIPQGQSNDFDPNILRVEITLRGLMSFIHVLATFELNERQYK